MFYSGWNFPTPRRIVANVADGHEANYFVQETGSPGISLLHFLTPTALSAGGSTTTRRDSDERIHLKSDVPIHRHSGVFYFEVGIHTVAPTTAGSRRGGRGGGTSERNSTASVGEPELVIGLCRESLPPHSLPGEAACSIGLFTAQRMVYMNGKAEGEPVRFPIDTRHHHNSNYHNNNNNNNDSVSSSGGNAGSKSTQEERRVKGITAGDTVGCIVNLMDGTLRFTYNGELLSFVGALNRRMPQQGYYPAVGVFRLVPAVTLRVVFQPLGRTALIPCPTLVDSGTVDSTKQEAKTTAVGYFVFDLDKYCEGIAENFVRAYQQKAADIWAGDEEGDRCTCRDANIIAAIRKHLAARGMTKALSAFEKEQQELRYTGNSGSSRKNSSNNNNNSNSTMKDGNSIPLQDRKKSYKMENEEEARAGKPAEGSDANVNREHHGSGSNMLESRNSNEPFGGVGDTRNIQYSLYIQSLREDICRGDILSSAHRILANGVLSPVAQDKLASVDCDVSALPPEFWGLIFFTQRRDILFLLRAAHIVEVALTTVAKELSSLLSPQRLNNNNNNNSSTPPPTSTTADIMELAFRVLIEPFDEIDRAVRRHQDSSDPTPLPSSAADIPGQANANTTAASTDVCIARNVAFRPFDGPGTAATPKWLSDDLAAYLFISGKDTVWSGPVARVTLLVRQSVPSVAPPNQRQQQRVVRMLSMLLSHQRAVCARVREELQEQQHMTLEWVEDWLSLVEEARSECWSRCWCLLLHAIEDFNGALEYRLLVWIRRHEEDLRAAEKGSASRHHNAAAHRRGSGSRHLFPSLRAAWRHVHAAAALEPLLHVVTRAFSDKLNRATKAAEFSTVSRDARENESNSGNHHKNGGRSGTSPAFGKGPKRWHYFTPNTDEDEDVDEGKGSRGGVVPAAATHPSTTANNSNGSEGCSSAFRVRTSYYTDDVRLSLLYMKRIYKTVFA